MLASKKVKISKSVLVKISMLNVCHIELIFSAVKDLWLIDLKTSEKTLDTVFDLRHFIFNV